MKMATTTITIKLRNKLVKIHESRRHSKAISYLRGCGEERDC